MRDCTYSKDPPAKKRKKYLDGFVKAVGQKIFLYDENKKNIFTTTKIFIENDECFKMGFYTVVVDDFLFLQGETNNEDQIINLGSKQELTNIQSSNIENKKVSFEKKILKIEKRKVSRDEFEDKKFFDANQNVNKAKGRGDDEIMNIFKNKF